MPMLGEILLAAKILTAGELDSALENHVMYGVKLGTYLVEAGYVSDDALAECLGRQAGQPFLAKDQLLVAGGQNLSLIPPAAIRKQRLIPVGFDGAKLRLATDNHMSAKKQAELENLIGRKIEFVVVSGYAVDSFLEHMFGVPRPGRFAAQFSRPRKQAEQLDDTGAVRHETAPVVINGVTWKTLGEVTQDEESAENYDEIFDTSLNNDDSPQTLPDAAEHLSNAKSRDDVARTVLGFVSSTCGSAALVVVRDGVVRGWDAVAGRSRVQDFEMFAVPLESLPDLRQCVVLQEPYSGHHPAPQAELLWNKLNCSAERVAYFPILIQKRVVAVLICAEADRLNFSEIAELCRKTSYALEILILRSKLLS